jgi:hypothetical protein
MTVLISEREDGGLSKAEASAVGSESPERGPLSVFDGPATKRLLRKLDWTLLPFLALLYLLSFLDRANIGNARLAGLEADLGMQGLDYNV